MAERVAESLKLLEHLHDHATIKVLEYACKELLFHLQVSILFFASWSRDLIVDILLSRWSLISTRFQFFALRNDLVVVHVDSHRLFQIGAEVHALEVHLVNNLELPINH